MLGISGPSGVGKLTVVFAGVAEAASGGRRCVASNGAINRGEVFGGFATAVRSLLLEVGGLVDVLQRLLATQYIYVPRRTTTASMIAREGDIRDIG